MSRTHRREASDDHVAARGARATARLRAEARDYDRLVAEAPTASPRATVQS